VVGPHGLHVEHPAQPGDAVVIAINEMELMRPRSSETSKNRKR
jgi:hypothetical protein